MIDLSGLEVWFVTGSQHLYGPDTLKTVEQHSATIGDALTKSSVIPVRIISKPVVTTSESIERLCLDANSSIALRKMEFPKTRNTKVTFRSRCGFTTVGKLRLQAILTLE